MDTEMMIRELKRVEEKHKHDKVFTGQLDVAKMAYDTRKRLSEHQWRRTAEGKIDEFAMCFDYHNGPVCERCGYSFCEHCEPNGWNEEPCVIDEYRCPTCNENIGRSDKYCKYCGQRLK